MTFLFVQTEIEVRTEVEDGIVPSVNSIVTAKVRIVTSV